MEKIETARDLRKKIKRLEESRDLQMVKNRDKSCSIKAREGRINELTESRNNWKKKYLALEQNLDILRAELEKKENEFKNREKELTNIVHEKEKILEKEKQEKINTEIEFQQKIDFLKKSCFIGTTN